MTSSRTHGAAHRAAILVAVVLAHSFFGPASHAQTRLQVVLSGVSGPGCTPLLEPPPVPPPCERRPGQILEIDLESASIVSQNTIPERAVEPRLSVTADGRYVVWGGQDDLRPSQYAAQESARFLSYRDRVTGAIVQPFRQFWPFGHVEVPRVFAHPTDVRVFVQFSSGALDASAAGIHERPFAPLAVSPDGSASVEVSAGNDWLIVDLATGIARCTVAQGPTLYSFVFSPNGETLYRLGGPQTTELAHIDARTCAVLRESDWPDFHGLLGVDPSTGRFFAVEPGFGSIIALDPVTMTPVGSLPGGPGRRLVFEAHRPRAYRLFGPGISDLPPFTNRVDVIDTQEVAIIASGTLTLDRRATDIAVVPLPPTPADVRAAVNGSQVTVEWRAGRGPGLATGYRLEAGSAAGLADIATFEQSGTAFGAGGVPSGTYFVRVRALNAGGAGPPSPEIVITVP
jgi:hypothetical protein